MFVTGGWDAALKYWDTRAATPLVLSNSLAGRVWAMDHRAGITAVCTSDYKFSYYRMESPLAPARVRFATPRPFILHSLYFTMYRLCGLCQICGCHVPWGFTSLLAC